MVRGEIHEWEVNRENIFSVEEIIIRDLSYEGRESKLFKSTNCETYTIIAEEEKNSAEKTSETKPPWIYVTIK